MGATFSKQPVEANTWQPEVLGINFTERLLRALGRVAEQGGEAWCAFVEVDDDETGPGYTEQITQENCIIVSSDLDDDADAIMLLDRRDQRWFRFTRYNHPESFNYNATIVMPWAQRMATLVPLAVNLKPVMDQLEQDVEGDDELFIPDTWN